MSGRGGRARGLGRTRSGRVYHASSGGGVSGGRWSRRITGNAGEAGAVATQSLRRSQLRFALTFIALTVVLFSIYSFPYKEHGISEQWFQRYLGAYARLAGFVLSAFDAQVGVNGNVIAGRFSLHIVKTCDAMEANLLFIAAIVALPARWSRKVVAGAVGVGILVIVNVIRICSLYVVGIYLPSAFDFLHVELWPLLIVVAALAEFVAWAVWMQRVSARDVPVESG